MHALRSLRPNGEIACLFSALYRAQREIPTFSPFQKVPPRYSYSSSLSSASKSLGGLYSLAENQKAASTFF